MVKAQILEKSRWINNRDITPKIFELIGVIEAAHCGSKHLAIFVSSSETSTSSTPNH
ncbi:hypothetical protein [Acaryochloris marina]|uniref:hypothetical protein n=1 Tax=Acaryochloris marina TaxID=155978 RepID=UPI001BB06BC6|nr:hypothetical protein [Acaryochloris marina]QUY41590.1 hypothetical protein I1H34_20455 [Acaryochloris marina S15]